MCGYTASADTGASVNGTVVHRRGKGAVRQPRPKTDASIRRIPVPEFAAELVYSPTIGEMLSRTISRAVLDEDGNAPEVLPEMYYILKDLLKVEEYNRIVASYAAGYLHLGISQGRNLLLANVFRAADFTTAEYFLFLAIRNLQLNPEVTSVYFRTPLSGEEEMSLYRYFKSVERL